MMQVHAVADHLMALADPALAQKATRFFKTGPGEYGEGDQFLGIRVPELRRLAKQVSFDLSASLQWLQSPYHEFRHFALLYWVHHYPRLDAQGQQALAKAYIDHWHRVNNWDLVDCSAHYILGAYLDSYHAGDTSLLVAWAQSPQLWQRRIAMVASWHWIRQNRFELTLSLCQLLFQDQEDLMHKACGWMLREVGKRDEAVLTQFLDAHTKQMPRTSLRYAIERLTPAQRQYYLAL
ncbi:hypothetical protein VST7929_01620 [Vibrio stylophorae]|uniref:DNA alkylation repair protein n=1 Tax=Vibrio stylophorae TaxID=659351 RepID=A0ABM8ZUT6_9VIBR|nr:DNA alkylation repair protein [Vibrio stylophorae]CAH0533745.1 hypothetical protein VST7929_01620 [Vibrio stylophorae]